MPWKLLLKEYFLMCIKRTEFDGFLYFSNHCNRKINDIKICKYFRLNYNTLILKWIINDL